MTEAPTKTKKVKVERGNIILDFLYGITVQFPILIFSWIVSKLD